MNRDPTTDISRFIWEAKYRLEGEACPSDTFRRVARFLASAERGREGVKAREEHFFRLMDQRRFLPGGRIIAGAGSGRQVTLVNCFVMGILHDTIPSIFRSLQEAALTMQQGGGIGCDFSNLRPMGMPARSTGNIASGPVSFMEIWDVMCATMVSTGARRGAMMATLRCDHPDIETFVAAKKVGGRLTNFNLSVLISDAFMEAVEEDLPWPLVFPCEVSGDTGEGETVLREWNHRPEAVPCRVHRTLSARRLWEELSEAAWQGAEPGVLFHDRINRLNNLGDRERIHAANPCGEVPLPPHGACVLGSLNLAAFVRKPFAEGAHMDLEALAADAATAVRLLDNVVSLTRYPLQEQLRQAMRSRRVGLGVMGLADALMMTGRHYGSQGARREATRIMRTIAHAAYEASVELAGERGPFPDFRREAYLQRPFVRKLPEPLRAAIAQKGIRNSHLLAVAPTGSISMLAGNVAGGVEPVFDFEYRRTLRDGRGQAVSHRIRNHAYARWLQDGGDPGSLPGHFVRGDRVSPDEQIAMQAALQRYVDNAISKTVQLPREATPQQVRETYRQAWERGLKGCTVYRPNPVSGEVLQRAEADVHCCSAERDPE